MTAFVPAPLWCHDDGALLARRDSTRERRAPVPHRGVQSSSARFLQHRRDADR